MKRTFLKMLEEDSRKMLKEASRKMLTKKCWKKPPGKMFFGKMLEEA
jgi:hypothetical protein